MRHAAPAVLVAAAALATAPGGAAAAPSPPGANDPGCRPSAERPAPVVLVHGTFADQSWWNALAPILRRDGFCVFSLDFGGRATQRMEASADEVAAFARRVLELTGAAKVSFVGHSQGGSLSRYVVRFRGLLDRTEDVVGLAPSSHGTTQPLAPGLGATNCPACADQVAGSPFMAALNAGDQAPAPVDWTVVATRHDQVVTPVESQFLRGSGGLRNVLVQDRCPRDDSEHVLLTSRAVAIQWARNALLRDGPAAAGFQPDCSGGSLGTDTEQTQRATTAGRPAAFLGPRALARGRDLVVGLQCSGAADRACRSHAVARVGTRRVASRRLALRPGEQAVVRLRLSGFARRVLARRGRLRVRVRVTTRDGEPRVVSRSFTVRAARAPRSAG